MNPTGKIPYKIKRVLLDWKQNEWNIVTEIPEDVTAWRIQNMSNVPVDWADKDKPPEKGDDAFQTLEPKSADLPLVTPEQLFMRRTTATKPTVLIVWTTSTKPQDIQRLGLITAVTARPRGDLVQVAATGSRSAATISQDLTPGDEENANGDWDLLLVFVVLDTNYTGDIIVTLNSTLGSVYDGQMVRATLTAETDVLAVFGADAYRFLAGDALTLTSDSNDTGDYAIIVVVARAV